MDYITRRSVATQGAVGIWITSGRNPFLEALGVRVSGDRINRTELMTALSDLGISVELPAGEKLPAEVIERALSRHAASELKTRMVNFLKALGS